MRIIKGTEAITVPHPVFMIFGQPGICKTSLAYSTEDPLLLDFDQGAHRAANRRDTLQIGSWADVAELMTHPEALEPYKTVIPDTVGRCLDTIIADIASGPNGNKLAPGGNPSQQGWGQLKSRFRTWTSQLRALGKDVLLVSHDKEDKDNDVRVVRPDIVGGSYGEVMKVADFVGYLYMSGRDRVLDFNPTDRWVGKNPARWEPFKVPPVGKAQEFMADLFARGREALGQISERSAEALKEVEAWREKIAGFKTATAFNEAIVEIKKLSPTLAPQVSKILLEAATPDRGVEFDRGAKAFKAMKKNDRVPA